MTTLPEPRRRDDPRMQTVEMAAIVEELEEATVGGSRRRRGPLSTRDIALLVAAGGALGSVARYLLEVLVPSTLAPTLVEVPWATWTANALGCLALGLLTGALEAASDRPAWLQPFLATGVCGGFTTMSALVLQVSAMIGAGFPLIALEYGIGTALIAIIAMAVGIAAGRLLVRRGPA